MTGFGRMTGAHSLDGSDAVWAARSGDGPLGGVESARLRAEDKVKSRTRSGAPALRETAIYSAMSW